MNDRQIQITLVPGNGKTNMCVRCDFSSNPISHALFQLSWPLIAFVFAVLISMDEIDEFDTETVRARRAQVFNRDCSGQSGAGVQRFFSATRRVSSS